MVLLLSNYSLISGDILHVEEITEWHYGPSSSPSDEGELMEEEESQQGEDVIMIDSPTGDNGDMMNEGDHSPVATTTPATNNATAATPPSRKVVYSHTQNYYLGKEIMIHVTETKDSYNYRKKGVDPNDFANIQQVSYIKLDIPVKVGSIPYLSIYLIYPIHLYPSIFIHLYDTDLSSPSLFCLHSFNLSRELIHLLI